MIAGWPDQPFSGQLQIILSGNQYTPEWPLPDGQNQGSKVLGKEVIKYAHRYCVYMSYLHPKSNSTDKRKARVKKRTKYFQKLNGRSKE